MFWIADHIEIEEHMVKFAKYLIIVHLFYTIYFATNKRTPVIFFMAFIAKRVWLLGALE